MKTSHPLRKLTTGLLCLVLNAAASGATREQADLGWRTWCELRPYGITQRLPLQEHRVYYTGLIRETDAIAADNRKVIRETDAIPRWDTVSVSRDGKPLMVAKPGHLDANLFTGLQKGQGWIDFDLLIVDDDLPCLAHGQGLCWKRLQEAMQTTAPA